MKKILSMKEFFVDSNIGRAESLPASAFVDLEFLELELGTIFTQTWLLAPQESNSQNGPAALTHSLRKTGSRVPFSLIGNPLFLQRGQQGKLRCLPNVCTHAWHRLVESSSDGGAIICPQHGRQFDNEGRFLAQAGFEKMEDFPRESDHLRSVHVEELGQWVFVSTGEPLAPFRGFMEKVQQYIP
jgi:choline monooxygenase